MNTAIWAIRSLVFFFALSALTLSAQQSRPTIDAVNLMSVGTIDMLGVYGYGEPESTVNLSAFVVTHFYPLTLVPIDSRTTTVSAGGNYTKQLVAPGTWPTWSIVMAINPATGTGELALVYYDGTNAPTIIGKENIDPPSGGGGGA